MRFAVFAFSALTAFAQAPAEKLAPYVPTPPIVVERMLKLGGLQPGEKMFDLGSGDGRLVIMAAKKFKADAAGVEIDEKLCRASSDQIRKLKLENRARIICGDILTQDYSQADLLTVYLFTGSNEKIRPLLEKRLRKGARVVTHDFEFANWKADKIELVEDDGEGRSHTLFYYLR